MRLMIKKRISRIKIVKMVMSILIIFAFILGIYGIIKDNSDNGNVYKVDANGYIDFVSNKIKIKQEINVKQGKFNNISIRPATYGRVNEGELIFKLYKAGNETLISTSKLNISKLINNEFVVFDFNTITVKDGESYYFTIETTSTDTSNSPAISKNTNEKSKSNLYINNENVEGELCYKVGYDGLDFTMCVIISIVIVIFTIVFSYFSNESIKRKNVIVAAIFFILSLMLVYLNIGVFYKENQINLHYLIIVLALIFSISYSLFFNNYLKETLNKVYSVILLFWVPFISLLIIELFNENIIYKMDFKIEVVNYFCVLLLYLFIYAITNRINIALIVGSVILYLIGLVYYYILLFRGSPILPTDFYAIETAASVAQNYKLTISLLIIITMFLMILICVICRRLRISFKTAKTSLYVRIILLVFVSMSSISANSFFEKVGITTDLWDQKASYKTNGIIVNFALNMKYLKVEVPQGYSVEKVNKLISQVDSEETNKMVENNIDSKRPNIIAIMNESFSDLSKIGNFNINQDYMPFIHNLNENTIKGNLFVSAFGAGTSTTEWEFLTGNSMTLLPQNSLPYQQYIHSESNSLASELKSLDYKTIALHPFLKTSWNRDKAYPLLGFDNFITEEDFENPELIRNAYISDSEDYKKIIQTYEEKQRNDKLFLFNVTIQNHGGYVTDNSIFKDSVYLTDKNYSDVNEYLSLIKKSDEAFQKLITYFSKQNEPTIIVMFGDHLPALNTAFYEELYKKPLSSLSLEEIEKQYTVPFIIWANYDIPEQYIDKISTNYLSTLLLDVAKLPLTGYNQFLKNTFNELPVINRSGYVDAKGNYYYHQQSEYQDLINNYKILEYNNMFDNKNKANSFFSEVK